MPARLFEVTILNSSRYPIVWVDDGREHGEWQEPWYPSNIKNLQRGEKASFRLESDGILTGVEGWALFKIDVPLATNVGPRTEYFRLDFERPYLEFKQFRHTPQFTLKDPRTNDEPHPAPALTTIIDHGYFDMAGANHPIEWVVALPYAPVNWLISAPVLLANESLPKHVGWVVEIRDTEIVSSLPEALKPATKTIIYGTTPRVEADATRIGHATPAKGGDLLWFEHEGRLDGSFNWEGPEKVGVRWDGLGKVFSGGDGIIYAVTPRNEATIGSDTVSANATEHRGGNIEPASGGDLLWYRHLGEADGTFRWQGPKPVGYRWEGFKHIFSGGEGVIYGVQENGDLMWYRHVGWADGTPLWRGPNKVGSGWGALTKVFSGGNGIIYGVTPRVEASSHITGGPIAPSGGELMWYQHKGWQDGRFDWGASRVVGTRWDGFVHLFSAGEGIIYGVTPSVAASFAETSATTSSIIDGYHGHGFTPASGGDLLWYRHLGVDDGSFKWEGPKKVGSGWGQFSALFAGDSIS